MNFAVRIPPEAMAKLRSRLSATEEELDALCGETGKEVRHRMAQRTPVLLGRARANWKLGVGAPDPYYEPDARDPSGKDGDAEAHETARNARVGLVLWITNRVRYILALNRGSSRKAPAGFIELTVAEIPFIVRQLARGMAGRLSGRGSNIGRLP